MLKHVLQSIAARERFVLTSHARPDGDAVGSALACAEILRSLGKQADVVMSDRIPYIYRALPGADHVFQASLVNGHYEAAILLECDSLARTGLEGLGSKFIVNIDHHLSGKPFGNINWIDPEACATAEMIYHLGRGAGVTISKEIATCLYTAVMTDSGSFRFAGTTNRTFELAADLVRCGADPVRCAQDVYFANPTSKMRLLGAALSTLQREGSLVWMHISRAQIDYSGAFDEDAEGLVNYAISIAGAQVAAFFRELPDKRYRVSLRSKGAVNVAAIAEMFGGGGHHNASGCSLDGPLPVAVERVLAQVRLRLAHGRAAHAASAE
ncbi:MAG: bifunctional oligoribonuclease/PAP phosphatase NrnA [Terriglobales bacterium]